VKSFNPKTGSEGSLDILATIDGWDCLLARLFLRSTRGSSFFSCRREISQPSHHEQRVCTLSLNDEGLKKRITCLEILELRQITLRKMNAWLFGFKVRFGFCACGMFVFKVLKTFLEKAV